MRTADVETLVKEAFSGESGEFLPCAWFDERLDCIRVVARDCSVLESRLSDRVTVLEDNYYPGPGRTAKVVGFTIKGARHFCHECGLDLNAPIKMTEVLDALVAKYPNELVKLFVDYVARPMIIEKQISQVDISEAELTAK